MILNENTNSQKPQFNTKNYYSDMNNQESALNYEEYSADSLQSATAKTTVIKFDTEDEAYSDAPTKDPNLFNVRISRKVVSFDTEEETCSDAATKDPTPFNVRTKQKVVSFDTDTESNKLETLNTIDSNLDSKGIIKGTQKVVSFANDNTNINDKLIKNKLYNTEATNFNDINFIIGANGHLYIDLNNGICELCNFYISPVKIIIRDNGLYTEKFYRLKFILENGEEEIIISISDYDLNDYHWINSKLGIKYYISAEKNSYALFKIYLSKQFRDIKQEYQYDMVGWKLINNKHYYLHGNGAIGSTDNIINGIVDRKIEIDNSLNAYSALQGALTLINLSDNDQKTLPLFLYSHLSVLTELFIISGARPKFALWIYGLTGSMKTSVSTIFFNLFNRISKPEISATFKDTPSAIEIKAFNAKDSTLLIDDYHPTTSSIEKRNMETLASHILRMYGDGITKSRATKTMGRQKEYPPRGLCVITGEDRLGGESTVARYLSIEVTAGDYKTEMLSYHQNNPLIYSTHMYYFIQWVSYNFNDICSFIKKTFPLYRNDSLNLFRHKRLNECFAVFRIISEIFINYCTTINYFNEDTADSTLKHWNSIMAQAIKLHEDTNTNQDPAIMYLIALDELISSNKCTLATLGQPCSEKQNILGYKDEIYYYLIPETAFINIRNFWKGQGIEFPVSQEQINKALDNLGVIETSIESGKTRRTVKCTPYGKKRLRCLKVDIEKYTKLLLI